jgi:hypothetical protein
VSTQWQQRTIKTKGSNFLIDFPSYTTRIGLEDQDGNPLLNEPLKVTASEWTYVTANGRIYSLDKDNTAVIPTDVTGALTIVSMASSISTPILYIEGDSFSKTLNIYPNGKVLKSLQGITTGSDLKAASGQDGKAVFTNSYSQATWDGVADNLHQLNTASSQLQTGTPPTGGAVFVSAEDLSGKHDGKLALGHLPAAFAVGMQRVNGAWQPHPNIKAAMSMSLGGVASSLEALPGDLLRDIGNVFEATSLSSSASVGAAPSSSSSATSGASSPLSSSETSGAPPGVGLVPKLATAPIAPVHATSSRAAIPPTNPPNSE